MKKDLTEIVFILDKSGSMHGLEKDTMGGFNAMIEKQKKEAGKALVTTFLFNNRSAMIHDRLPIDKIPELTEKDYVTGGCTALLDATGTAIRHIEKIHKYARTADLPAHTLFVITTDGLENASRSYTFTEVKDMITEKREKNGWEFIFLGADIDADLAAEEIGIAEERAAAYHNDGKGIANCFGAVDKAIKTLRKLGSIEEDWADQIYTDD